MPFQKQIELDFCTVTLRHDGIVENRFVNDTAYVVDANHLTDIKEAMYQISEGQQKAILSIAGLYGSMTPEARDVDINGATDYTLALALVIQELSQRLLASFYFKIKRVDYPIKTFKREEEAVAWLAQQIRAKQQAG